MLDLGALIVAAVTLVTALLEERRRREPARRADEFEGDLAELDRALAAGDAAGIAARFERERRAALRLVPPGAAPSAER